MASLEEKILRAVEQLFFVDLKPVLREEPQKEVYCRNLMTLPGLASSPVSEALVMQVLHRASPYVVSEGKVRLKAVPASHNTLVLSGKALPPSEQGIIELLRLLPFPVEYARKHPTKEDSWLVTFPPNTSLEAMVLLKKSLGKSFEIDHFQEMPQAKPQRPQDVLQGKPKQRSLTTDNRRPNGHVPVNQIDFSRNRSTASSPTPPLSAPRFSGGSSYRTTRHPSNPPPGSYSSNSYQSRYQRSSWSSEPDFLSSSLPSYLSHPTSTSSSSNNNGSGSGRYPQLSSQTNNQSMGPPDRSMKKSNSKKNLNPQGPLTPSSPVAASTPRDQVGTSGAGGAGGAGVGAGGHGADKAILGPLPKEIRAQYFETRWSRTNNSSTTSTTTNTATAAPINPPQKQRSQTESSFFQVAPPTRHRDGYEGAFQQYTLSQIMAVIRSRPNPPIPASLNDPTLHVTLVNPVSPQEVIDRHPIDRSMEVLSSRQKGERSKNRGKRKASGSKNLKVVASGLSSVSSIPDSPECKSAEGITTPWSSASDPQIQRVPNAFDDDEPEEARPAATGRERKMSSSFDSKIPVASSVSSPRKPSPTVCTSPIAKPSSALTINTFQTSLDSQNLFTTSPDADDDDEADDHGDSPEHPTGRPTGILTPLTPSDHLSLGSPSSPKHRRHVSEPFKLKALE